MPQIHSIEAKIQKNRRFGERLADDISKTAGSFAFFIFNLGFFVFWILFNLGKIPGLYIIDPYPFTLLTMIVSLEAIFLSIFVLMSQNNQTTIDSLREEIHLQLNEIAEREITKSLQLISEIHAKLIPGRKSDPSLERMLKALDMTQIESKIEKELDPQPLVISELVGQLEKKLRG